MEYWNDEEILNQVQKELFAMQDLQYRDFHAKLMPTMDKKRIIGVRTPKLRLFAKAFGKTNEAQRFLEMLPHRYYEENHLHGLLLDQVKDYQECIRQLNQFLPFVDNWATCDMLAVRVVKQHLDQFREEIMRWISCNHTYTIRFGISMLMKYYLDGNFKIEYAEWVANICSKEYYVNMVRAWYFATALAKQYEQVLPFLEEQRLDRWTHNKTIQKAVESNRITEKQKEILRTLRIKNERGNQKDERKGNL